MDALRVWEAASAASAVMRPGFVLADLGPDPDQHGETLRDLPADAKLTIGGMPTVSTSESRVFESPSLTPGKTFYYVLKATVDRDGKTETVTKEVAVCAGEETRVKIEIPEAVTTED